MPCICKSQVFVYCDLDTSMMHRRFIFQVAAFQFRFSTRKLLIDFMCKQPSRRVSKYTRKSLLMVIYWFSSPARTELNKLANCWASASIIWSTMALRCPILSSYRVCRTALLRSLFHFFFTNVLLITMYLAPSSNLIEDYTENVCFWECPPCLTLPRNFTDTAPPISLRNYAAFPASDQLSIVLSTLASLNGVLLEKCIFDALCRMVFTPSASCSFCLCNGLDKETRDVQHFIILAL